jgi:hypothetical protein
MNWVVVRIFEGYYFPSPIKAFLIGRKQQRKLNLAQSAEKRRQTLKGKTESTEEYQQHWRLYIELKNEHHEQYPPDFQNVLPTRLGNVYRAFEDYAFERYGMEGLFFWERLSKVVPEDYAAKIEELNNSVAFLLNSSLASFIVASEIIVKDMITIDPHLLNSVANTRPFSFRIVLSFLSFQPPSTRIALSLLVLGLGYFFYHAAVSTARTLGRHVRTSYDLFRLDLLEELNVDPPAVLGGQQEKDLWRSVHEFLALGEGSPYKPSESEYTLSVLESALQSFRELVWLSLQIKLWEGLSFLLDQIKTLTDRSRYRSRYVVINDGAD